MAFLSVACLVVAKGVYIAFFVITFNKNGIDLPSTTATLMIGLQFLPQLILSIFTTIGFSWSSMKLIIYHPETLLLSTGKHFQIVNSKIYMKNVLVTFYTVAKGNVICGRTDHKIGLSKGWSYANLLLSTICFAGGTYWISVYDTKFGNEAILLLGGPLYISAAFFTVIFIHYDCCCASCCCDCCIGEEQVVIHDPSNPEANLVWRNKQVSMLTNYLLQ